MRHALLLLALGVATACATSVDTTTVTPTEKIIHGTASSIAKYPYIVSLLHYQGWWWWASYEIVCVGTIVNYRTVLTAARCVKGDPVASQWRIRAGSSYSNTGGSVYSVSAVYWHADYKSHDSDIAIVRPTYSIIYSDVIKPATIVGSDYYIPDYIFFTAAGWGPTYAGGSTVTLLREVQVLSVNTTLCKSRYSQSGYTVTDNMVCAGTAGDGPCSTGDFGGPLIRDDLVVGIFSWQMECTTTVYPSLYTRLSRFANWIQVNS